MPCEECRNWGDASKNQGMTKIASKPPEARREAGSRFSLNLQKQSIVQTP